jgi:hypothetical protein
MFHVDSGQDVTVVLCLLSTDLIYDNYNKMKTVPYIGTFLRDPSSFYQ